MRTILAQDEASFLKKAAQIFMESAASAVEARDVFTVALSGGNTPKKLYALLADSYYRNRIPWTKTHVFWGDERMVPANHPDSNFKMAQEQLFAHVPIPSVNIHPIPTEMGSTLDVSRAYEQQMRVFFRNQVVKHPDSHLITQNTTGDIFPCLDLALLGVGEDGHTASLFPGSSVLTEKVRWVAGGFVERVNGDRITMTFPVINNARQTLILCTGENKAGVVREIFQGDESSRRFPVQMVKPASGELTWLLDRGAASQLPAAVRHKALHI